MVIERDGQILLLRRSLSKDHGAGEWEPLSGRAAPGESPLEAARREAKEETGLDVEVLYPFDTFHFYRGAAREEAVGITFYGRSTGGELTLSAEHDASRWVPVDELLTAPLTDSVRRCFEAFLPWRAQVYGR